LDFAWLWAASSSASSSSHGAGSFSAFKTLALTLCVLSSDGCSDAESEVLLLLSGVSKSSSEIRVFNQSGLTMSSSSAAVNQFGLWPLGAASLGAASFGFAFVVFLLFVLLLAVGVLSDVDAVLSNVCVAWDCASKMWKH
jgi:hypothetical protein